MQLSESLSKGPLKGLPRALPELSDFPKGAQASFEQMPRPEAAKTRPESGEFLRLLGGGVRVAKDAGRWV